MDFTVGSVCSGIEAASVAWKPLGAHFEWFSEIAAFPSRILAEKYPDIPNVGDMRNIPDMILQHTVYAPDIICGGTPCQAFSLAGWQNGLHDDRGNLTLRFVDIIEANDAVRREQGKSECRVFWENVEGVLSDKTNAFGCFVSSLAGLSEVLKTQSGNWPNAGLIRGKKRNVAWRVLDAKFFGLPQQRRRLYVVAGGKDFSPEGVLFELHQHEFRDYPSFPLVFQKEGHSFEVFREYTDCLYSAYGTKWNGNAAAYNGSLFVVQDHRIRRFSPLETERLMGLPDHYTDLKNAKKTNRYQAIGNSWAVPVVRWIGERIINDTHDFAFDVSSIDLGARTTQITDNEVFYNFGSNIVQIGETQFLNCTSMPEHSTYSNIADIISSEAPEDIYISPVGCYGIIRRKKERGIAINTKLEEVLLTESSRMPPDEIEKRSRVQHRGRFSLQNKEQGHQLSLFDSV